MNNIKGKSKDTQRASIVPTRLYKSMARSRITNGKDLLPGIDQRNIWCRRFRDVRALHLEDLGGEDNCSAAEQSIIRRAACLTVELERMELVFAEDGKASPTYLELYARMSSVLRRLLESVGLSRRARDVTPDLQTYLRMKEEAAE